MQAWHFFKDKNSTRVNVEANIIAGCLVILYKSLLNIPVVDSSVVTTVVVSSSVVDTGVVVETTVVVISSVVVGARVVEGTVVDA